MGQGRMRVNVNM